MSLERNYVPEVYLKPVDTAQAVLEAALQIREREGWGARDLLKEGGRVVVRLAGEEPLTPQEPFNEVTAWLGGSVLFIAPDSDRGVLELNNYQWPDDQAWIQADGIWRWQGGSGWTGDDTDRGTVECMVDLAGTSGSRLLHVVDYIIKYGRGEVMPPRQSSTEQSDIPKPNRRWRNVLNIMAFKGRK